MIHEFLYRYLIRHKKTFSQNQGFAKYACSVIKARYAASKVYENILTKSKELGLTY